MFGAHSPRPTPLVGRAAARLACVAAMAIQATLATPASADAAGKVAAAAQLAAEVVDAGRPSISADGRWVVFEGTADGTRRSVYRTDRVSGETIQLSFVPDQVRAGDTVRPKISADGCVVAAISEIAFDLFRDDDRDARWDAYRLVVPECGGQFNGWELISTRDTSGVARDDVSPDFAPALSGAGGLVAYTHPLDGAPDGVTTISLVDVTVPVSEPARTSSVVGIPVELPGSAFLYRGARFPVLSENGRHMAFVSDTTASDALPGWGKGRVLGDYATSQVYVWDRGVADQRRSVRLISGVNGVPSTAGADSPAMSEDGRIVVFVSGDRTLVPAELPRCQGTCASQIYRFDRDTDRNGIFDEPARRPQLALVSAIDAGQVDAGVPVAGDGPSRDPAVNADGSQIAFVTDAVNLMPSRRSGGGAASDGDLLVAEFQLGQIRRVLDGADATGVPGAHGHPALSKTGQVAVFDTAAAVALGMKATGRTLAAVEFTPRLSLAALDFGTVLPGFDSTELYVKVLNAGPAAFEPSDVTTSSPNFRITGGTCNRGIIVAAGTTCSVKLTFNPTGLGGFRAELRVTGRNGRGSVIGSLHGSAGDPVLLAQPGGVDLDDGVVGGVGGRVAIDISNIDYFPTAVTRLVLAGANPDDFRIVTEACTGRDLNVDATCAVEVEFRPKAAGFRSALLIATALDGAYTAAVLGGLARYEPELVGLYADDTAGLQPGIVRQGEPAFVGGKGFPAEVEVSVGFDDGGAPFATVTTTPDGTFLVELTMPARIRVGPRRLVASAADGAVATAAITVVGRIQRTVPAPGYGLGLAA